MPKPSPLQACSQMSLSDILADPTVQYWTVGLLLGQLVFGLTFGGIASPVQKKAAFAAHQLCCFAAFVYCTAFGTSIWLNSSSYRTGASFDVRLYGCTEDQSTIVKMMLGFQVYDAVVTLLVTDLRSAVGMVHHIVTGLFMVFALLGGVLMPYAPFFCGIAEISSLPLSIFDLFKGCKELSSVKSVAPIGDLAKILFAVIFLIVRVVWWPLVIYQMLADIHASQSHPQFWFPAAAFHTTAAVGLTLLQQFWGTKVISGIVKLVTGDKPKKKN